MALSLRNILKPSRWKKLFSDLIIGKHDDELVCKEFIEYDTVDKSPRKRADVEKTLRVGCQVLEELGVKYWVDRGTLLGFYRDNDFLPSDIDLDISVYSDKDVYRIVQKLPFDPLYVTSSRGHYMQFAFLDKETDVIFDIWFFHDRAGRLYNRNYFGSFSLPPEKIADLKAFNFSGKDYPVPDPEWYCRYWYGANWREPKAYGKDWTIEYRKDCEGFAYSGVHDVTDLSYYKKNDDGDE